MSEAEARRRASLELGGIEQVKEACRDARGTRWVEDLGQDLRYGCRVLRKSPVFTVVAALSLALGIGANSAVFSLVDRLVLRALPVRDPQELVRIEGGGWTNPIWEQIRDRQHQLFDGAIAWSDDHVQFDLAAGGPADLVDGLWVSGDFFRVLGVPVLLGRTIEPTDDRRGGGPYGAVAVISYRFWQRRFGGAADVVGRSVTVNRVPYTIVGVTAAEFFGPSVGRSFDLAVPLGTEPLMRGRESFLDNRSAWWLEIAARLKPGQTVLGATNALRAVQGQVRAATTPEGWPAAEARRYLREGLSMVPYATGPSELRLLYQRPLFSLMAVAGLVLLLACANLANLLLARADARRHELTMRLTLGASRLRLARQLLTESLLLASLGALLGMAFARWGSEALVRRLPVSGSRVFLDLSLDWRSLSFTVIATIGTALLVGILPAFRVRGADPNEALKQPGSRALAGEGRQAVSGPLVVAQVALSLPLVVAAGLFLRTFSSLVGGKVGFDPARILVVNVDAQRSATPPGQRLALFERVLQAASGVPGVARAAASFFTPMSGQGWQTRLDLPERPDLSWRDRLTWVNAVSPGWFSTYGTRLEAGRDFEAHDSTGAPRVAIVNQAFVRRYLRAAAPLGRSIRQVAGPPGHPAPPMEIVGVVEDATYGTLREPHPPTIYLPLAQAGLDVPFVSLSIRAARGSRASLAKDVAAAASAEDPNLSLVVRPLAQQIDASLARERILAILSSFFGALAIALAGIGLYGVASYAVNRRRTEIGVRIAIGADTARVMRLVVGRVALLVSLGIVVGGVFSLWASTFLGALLFGVQPHDPLTFAGAALVLAAIAALASWFPARRAARIDPALVLREG